MRAELITTRCDFFGRKQEDANLFLHIPSVSLQTILRFWSACCCKSVWRRKGELKERERNPGSENHCVCKKERKKEKDNRRGRVDGPKVIVAG